MSYNTKKSPFKWFCDLYEQGYSLVPLTKEKIPLAKWKDLQVRQPRPSEVKEMVGQYKSCNWGLITGKMPIPAVANATGLGIVILDADNQDAIDLVEDLCPPTPVVVTSPRGGKHYYYRRPHDEVRNRQDTTTGGKTYKLDLRGDGGLVVAPGGTRQDGRRYTASMPINAETLSACPVYDPEWIPLDGPVREVTQHDYDATAITSDDLSTSLDDRIEQATAWLNRTPGSQQGRGADSYCYAIAVRAVWGFALPEDVAIDLLYDWGNDSSNVDADGHYYPWTISEIRHKVSSALATEYDGKIGDALDTLPLAAQALYDDPTRFVSTIPKFETPTVKDDKNMNTTLDISVPTLIDIHAMQANAANQQEDWLIPNWLEFGSIGMLTGDPFSGKSSIVAELIAACAKYGRFGPYDVPSCPVILIDLENRDRIIVRRLSRSLGDDTDALSGRLGKILVPESWMPLDPKKIESFITASLKQYNPALFKKMKPLVIIDTYRSAFEASEMDVDEAKKLLYPLQRVAQRTDAAILILHHRPKSGAKYSGQSSIAGCLDYMWLWDSNVETKEAKLSLEGTRGDLQQPMYWQLNEDNRNVYRGDSTTKAKQVSDLTEHWIIQVLQGHPDGLTQKAIIAEVKNLWVNAPGEKKIRATLEQMADRADLICKSSVAGAYRYRLIGA